MRSIHSLSRIFERLSEMRHLRDMFPTRPLCPVAWAPLADDIRSELFVTRSSTIGKYSSYTLLSTKHVSVKPLALAVNLTVRFYFSIAQLVKWYQMIPLMTSIHWLNLVESDTKNVWSFSILFLINMMGRQTLNAMGATRRLQHQGSKLLKQHCAIF